MVAKKIELENKVENMEELFAAYDQSKDLCMMLQEFIHWEQYVRCICIGKNRINVPNMKSPR